MSSAPVMNIDPADFWQDPYPTLAEMRSVAPICYVPEIGATLITRRDDIHTCEKNVRVFSSDQPSGLMNVLMGRNMMRKDGEEHRKERFVYYPTISPRKVEQIWAELFAKLTSTILDRFASSGSTDLVPDYAIATSGEALKAMTGLVQVKFEDLDAWSQAMIDGVANYIGDPLIEARCVSATEAIDLAIDQRLADIREKPDASLLSVMTQAGMPEEMVRANIKLTISGGQNEPRDAIAGAIWALLEHPDQLELVTSGAVSWQQVFEEYCRWIAPIGMSPRRIATEHSYGGVEFEAEDRVFFMFSSANRDESHFDHPNDFNVTRDTSAALTFGAGPHFCAGAAASRSLVGDVALPKIFERLKGLRLDANAPTVEFRGWAFRGPLSVPVLWGNGS
ncbi:MAG: cytochrome P450 [Actinomycetota bacterium]|nr:cytochrome P450 [Actinomycetota bacterium]MDG2120685.1 cytochrome P450 [Actinomycetota bacterium]